MAAMSIKPRRSAGHVFTLSYLSPTDLGAAPPLPVIDEPARPVLLDNDAGH
jgi:hypothetical protein